MVANPCEHTELPKVITRKSTTVTADEFDRLLAAVPERHRVMVETAIETGMRWGELIALRPRHIDFLRKTVTVEETIVEVSRKHSPTGERYVVKPYPEGIMSPEPSASTTTGWRRWPLHIQSRSLGRDQLLFTTTAGTPISRNTFRTRVWLPGRGGQRHRVQPWRMHDLRHAHASWILGEGSDLKSVMDRMGHAQIQTTQKYLHAQPDADRKNLDALARARRRQSRKSSDVRRDR